MKKYETPILNIYALSADDIIKTSGRDPIETEEDIFDLSHTAASQEH